MLKRFSRFLSYTIILSLIMPSGGIFSLQQASAATVMAVDSFGTFSTPDVPNWVDGGGSTIFDTYTTNATPRPGSATTQHARLRDGGHITKTVSTSGFTDIILNYYWHGDTQAENSDKFLVQWKKTTDNTFLTLRTDDLNTQTNGWSNKISISLPAAANNTSIDIRFVGASNSTTEEARVDDVSVDGTPLTPPVLTTIGDKTVNELSTLTFTATATNLNNLTPTYDLTQGPTGATIDANTGVFSWTPTEAQGPGVYPVTVRVLISQSLTDTETLNVTVNEVNTNPVANAQSITTDEDTVGTGTLSATDTDLPAQALTYMIVSNPTHGNITNFNANTGAFTYTPAANYNGSDSFTFKANDGTADSEVVTESITINPVPDTPYATPDFYSVDEDQTLTVDAAAGVLANDSDPDGNPLSTSVLTSVEHGTLQFNSDGAFVYTPNANYNGTDTFTYQGIDGNPTLVTITVNPVPDTPYATPDFYSVDEDQTLTVDAAAGVLANDSDPDGNPLSAAIVDSTTHGTLTFHSDGSFEYTPEANFNGTDVFTYRAIDGSDMPVTITVNSVNDVPTATNLSLSTSQGVAKEGTLLGDDADKDTLIFATTTPPAHGSFALFDPNTGAFVYTPDQGFFGEDSFTFTVSDAVSTSEAATVDITVAQASENTLELCSDGIDNDGDESIDLNDSDCTQFKPKLTVTKVVVNDNGGTKSEKDFQLFVNQTETTSGSEVTLDTTGTSTVSETRDDGYAGTFSGDCDKDGQVVLNAGDVKSCTLTNNDLPATLSLFKKTTGGDGSFDFTITGNDEETVTHTLTTIDGFSVEKIELNPGTYTITEPTTPGWTLAYSYCVSGREFRNVDAPRQSYELTVNNGDVLTCEFQNTKTEPTPPPVVTGGGGGGGGFYSLGGCKDIKALNYDPYVTTDNGSCKYATAVEGSATSTDAGQVLGASTSCGLSITKYLRANHKNDSEQVKKLQKFLNDYLKLNIPLTGVFGPRTERAVKQFQTLRKENILTPWKLDSATGVVYLTTATDINNIMCPDLKLPIPTTLVPYHE